MAAFIKLKGIEGEANDKDHDKWITVESMSAPIFRNVPDGARGVERSRGNTTTGDVAIVRQLDKSSTKIQEACANGTFFEEAEIHFCTQVGNKQEPYLKYKLKDCIITSYSMHGTGSGNPLPSEELTLGYTGAEWTYIVINPKTGKAEGNVPAKYDTKSGS
jgi:type VI secretion system secreted protein Hcp